MKTHATHATHARHGLTLTELLIAVGLIALLVCLLLPVLGKVRAAANASLCLSNLRQMGTAWTVYAAENRGELPAYVWHTPQTPDISWNGYWPGLLEKNGVKGETLLCPAASEVTPSAQNKGYGTATHAWTGKYSSNGSVVRFNATKYRDGSYGYNRYLTAGGGFGGAGPGAVPEDLKAVDHLGDVPVFMDAAYVDCLPVNGSAAEPPKMPPDLLGTGVTVGSPDHWRFLLARHGRGINVNMADGSTRWVPLAETYMLTWKAGWTKYRLQLPNS